MTNGESPNSKNIDYVKQYRDALREGVEEIAKEEQVGIWKASDYTLDDVSSMLSSPTLFNGVDIPNESELIRIKKILSARKVIAE